MDFPYSYLLLTPSLTDFLLLHRRLMKMGLGFQSLKVAKIVSSESRQVLPSVYTFMSKSQSIWLLLDIGFHSDIIVLTIHQGKFGNVSHINRIDCWVTGSSAKMENKLGLWIGTSAVHI